VIGVSLPVAAAVRAAPGLLDLGLGDRWFARQAQASVFSRAPSVASA
jgi:hypothetical protein